MGFEHINHRAVIVCILLSMLIPMGWYAIFANAWMTHNNLTLEIIESKSNTLHYVAALISGLISSYVLAWLWWKMKISNGITGLFAALLIGLGLILSTVMVHDMFEYRAPVLAWINQGQTVVWMMASGYILGAWKKNED